MFIFVVYSHLIFIFNQQYYEFLCISIQTNKPKAPFFFFIMILKINLFSVNNVTIGSHFADPNNPFDAQYLPL